MASSDWMIDRRRTVRVELLAALQGQLLALDEDARVSQLSLGGLLIETRVPLSLRTEHDLRVTADGDAVDVRARVLHSRVTIVNDDVTYLSGLEFIQPSADALTLVRRVLERARAETGAPAPTAPPAAANG